MKFNISTYWKCQLIGWALYAFIPIFFMLSVEAEVYTEPGNINSVKSQPFLPYYIVICIEIFFLGILLSHLMKIIFHKTHTLEKSLAKQILIFFCLTIIFSVFFLVSINMLVNGPKFFSSPIMESGSLSALLFQGIIFSGAFLIWNLIYFVIQYIRKVRKKEEEKATLRIQLVESEAQALRAQMNPHFIFNSLNSIKSLINKNENNKAANYLTTFSKLIRTLFHNSDRREVSLFEEIETCKLYTQLERMRFGDKIEFIFDVNESIDLKAIKVPALILQPLIENAIWHGLVPKEPGGRIVFSVKETNNAVECIIDDDGIGRELSSQYNAEYRATHQSKGIGMTQSRLELDKLLNEREDTIHIIDKKNADGTSGGTKVIITFKQIEN